MFQLKSEKELLAAFRTRDRKHVEPPPGLQYPLFVRNYLSWVDPTGVRAFIVFAGPDESHPTGIAFRRDQTGEGGGSGLCEWCHSSGSSDEIGLLTTDVSGHKRVGVYLCRDLRCEAKIQDAADRSGRNPIPPTREALLRMSRFAENALGIKQTNR